MLTVKEVLHGKIGLDLRCVDRVLLNGWVRYLQMPGGVVNFIREQYQMSGHWVLCTRLAMVHGDPAAQAKNQ